MFAYLARRYPVTPGCYLMKNSAGQVIYVGKAINLRRRLGQYFQTTRQMGKIKSLVAEIDAIEVILVHTEIESLILENNLIKRYHPRYNVLLVSDDSGYGYVVQTAEAFPRLLPYRKARFNKPLDGARPIAVERRFGPYLTRTIRDTLIRCIGESCGLRTCDTLGKKVCFEYHLKRCSGICEGLVSAEEYRREVERAAGFLAAPHLRLIGHLTGQMKAAAEALEFERAKRIRDQIATLETVFERQAVERDVRHDQDVVWLDGARALILHIQKGALISLEWLPQVAVNHSPEAFFLDHYTRAIPPEIITNSLPNPTLTEAVLAERSGRVVKINVPSRGVGRDLLEIARMNLDYRASLEEVEQADPLPALMDS